ncbi:hypothetical protein FQA39_LY10988 [Lamprigera yunnana]|nr:hypothetical protein FQA39_LY10988 [Lamprigera yunnana]
MADDLDELMVLVKICVKECMMYCSEWLVASDEWMTNNPSAVVSRWRAQLQVQCPRTVFQHAQSKSGGPRKYVAMDEYVLVDDEVMEMAKKKNCKYGARKVKQKDSKSRTSYP